MPSGASGGLHLITRESPRSRPFPFLPSPLARSRSPPFLTFTIAIGRTHLASSFPRPSSPPTNSTQAIASPARLALYRLPFSEFPTAEPPPPLARIVGLRSPEHCLKRPGISFHESLFSYNIKSVASSYHRLLRFQIPHVRPHNMSVYYQPPVSPPMAYAPSYAPSRRGSYYGQRYSTYGSPMGYNPGYYSRAFTVCMVSLAC